MIKYDVYKERIVLAYDVDKEESTKVKYIYGYKGEILYVGNEKPRIIEELPIIDDAGKFRFISNSVAEVKQEVEAKISKGIELIDEFENIYRTIDWESDAATAYKTLFGKLKEEVVTSLNNLKKDFSELMAQAEQDAKLTEDTNTVE